MFLNKANRSLNKIDNRLKIQANTCMVSILHSFTSPLPFCLKDIQLFYSHKLSTEICEVWPIFKGDLIKFCEILTKITLKLYQNSQKALFK